MKRIAFVLAIVSMSALAGAQTAKAHKLTGWIGDFEVWRIHAHSGLCEEVCRLRAKAGFRRLQE